MNGAESYTIQLINALGQIITSNKLLIASLFLLYIGRGGIAELIKKIVCLDFSWGKAKGSIRTIPNENSHKDQNAGNLLDTPRQETDISKEVTDEKEEKAKHWFVEMHMAFLNNNFDEAEKIFEKNIESISDKDERIRNKIIYLNWRYTMAGDKNALKQLEHIYYEAEGDELKSTTASWLSNAYSRSRDFASSEKIWRELINSTQDEDKKAMHVANLSDCYIQQTKVDEARKLIHKNLIKAKSGNSINTLYKALADIEKKHGDMFIGAIAIEKAVEAEPDNTDLLFNAAYRQGNTDLSYLSYLNYDTVLSLSPNHSTALNNIGVEASKLDLKGMSVRFYNRSAETGNTLAMANIAYLYLSKGFFKEAQEIITTALQDDHPHNNVASALSELNKAKQNEDEIEEEVRNKGIKQREFIRKFADALFVSECKPISFQGIWIFDEKDEIAVEITNDSFKAKWEKVNALSQYKYEYSLNGKINNGTITGNYKVSSPSPLAYISIPGGYDRNFIAFINSQFSTIEIMFRDNKDPLFMVLNRKNKNS